MPPENTQEPAEAVIVSETTVEESGLNHYFSPGQIKSIYVIVGLFGLSTAGSVLGMIFSEFLTMLVFAWYAGVIGGVILILYSFVLGLTRVTRDGGKMIGSAVLVLLIMLLVGGGTCFVNIVTFSA